MSNVPNPGRGIPYPVFGLPNGPSKYEVRYTAPRASLSQPIEKVGCRILLCMWHRQAGMVVDDLDAIARVTRRVDNTQV
jgi:hypothetical protein